MSECNCILEGDDDRPDTACNEKSPDGTLLCSKPDGHDGPHAACNFHIHPVDVWEVDPA